MKREFSAKSTELFAALCFTFPYAVLREYRQRHDERVGGCRVILTAVKRSWVSGKAVMRISSFQKIFAIPNAEIFRQLHQLFVGNGIQPRQMRGEHIDLRRFFDGFDQPERLVHGLA